MARFCNKKNQSTRMLHEKLERPEQKTWEPKGKKKFLWQKIVFRLLLNNWTFFSLNCMQCTLTIAMKKQLFVLHVLYCTVLYLTKLNILKVMAKFGHSMQTFLLVILQLLNVVLTVSLLASFVFPDTTYWSYKTDSLQRFAFPTVQYHKYTAVGVSL